MVFEASNLLSTVFAVTTTLPSVEYEVRTPVLLIDAKFVLSTDQLISGNSAPLGVGLTEKAIVELRPILFLDVEIVIPVNSGLTTSTSKVLVNGLLVSFAK